MSVIQAYQFALDPTPAQREALLSHCGGQRVAFNWGLARVKANLAQREAERSYGVADNELTPRLNWSAYSLRKAWNAAKHEVAPWWNENSKEAYASGLANLSTALGNWNDSRNGRRAGKKSERSRQGPGQLRFVGDGRARRGRAIALRGSRAAPRPLLTRLDRSAQLE